MADLIIAEHLPEVCVLPVCELCFSSFIISVPSSANTQRSPEMLIVEMNI